MAEDVAAYIARKGWKPAGLLHSSEKWFAEHPDVYAAGKECRALGLSRTQTLQCLRDLYGFPFTSDNSVKALDE